MPRTIASISTRGGVSPTTAAPMTRVCLSSTTRRGARAGVATNRTASPGQHVVHGRWRDDRELDVVQGSDQRLAIAAAAGATLATRRQMTGRSPRGVSIRFAANEISRDRPISDDGRAVDALDRMLSYDFNISTVILDSRTLLRDIAWTAARIDFPVEITMRATKLQVLFAQ